MATAERREARRRKLLQNPEDRLQRILGSRSSHPSSTQSHLEPDENVLKSLSAKNKGEMELIESEPEVRVNDLNSGEKEALSAKKALAVEGQAAETENMEYFGRSNDLEAEGETEQVDRIHSSENQSKKLPEETSTSQPQSKRWRVVFNVFLAFVLISKWTYVNLEVLLSTDDKQAPDSSHKLIIHSESMMWPFLALQLFFVCVTSFQKTFHSPFISMLTVALQLCGIPIQFTHKINFVLTALLAALKDFVVFLFSVIIIHHAMEYSINSGLLKQVIEMFE